MSRILKMILDAIRNFNKKKMLENTYLDLKNQLLASKIKESALKNELLSIFIKSSKVFMYILIGCIAILLLKTILYCHIKKVNISKDIITFSLSENK